MTGRVAEESELGSAERAERELKFLTISTQEDRNRLRLASALALFLHSFLLAIHLPEITRPALAEPEKRVVFAVQPNRWLPPEVDLKDKVSKPRVRKEPIPCPSPNLPEPLRSESRFDPELESAETGFWLELPSEPPPTMPSSPIMMTPDIVRPVRIYDPPPQYTELARIARIEGAVIVQAIIDHEGNVTEAEVLKGLPMGLDVSALQAVRQWRFAPARRQGKPVSVFYTLTIHFELTR